MPILVVYSLSLELTFSDVGFVDVISSAVYLLLNIPIGWVADRLSRKVCNLVGDVIYGISLLALGLSTSISGVITAYILMSLGAACSQGADVALYEAHCKELGIDYEDASKRLVQARTCIGMLAYLCCSILVAWYGMKTAVLIASLPYFVGAVLCCFVQEIGVHKELEPLGTQPLRGRIHTELKGVTKGIRCAPVKDRHLTELSWLLITSSVGKAMTGPVLLFVGPMLLLASGNESHIPLSYIVLGVVSLIAGEVSRRGFRTASIRTQFMWACVLALTAMGILGLHLSVWTVGLFLIVHTVRTWIFAAMPPLVQKAAAQDLKATVSSLLKAPMPRRVNSVALF